MSNQTVEERQSGFVATEIPDAIEDAHAQGHAVQWHTSYWPLLVSFGALFLVPLAFIFHFVYKNPLLAVLSVGIGAPLTLISIIGWVKEGIEDVHGYSEGHSVWAMPLFIVAEALLFVGFFVGYWVLRLTAPAWPPAGTPEKELIVPIIMTVILLASSVTIHLAERQLEPEVNDRPSFMTWLVVTMILGAVFMGLSAWEWSHLFNQGFNIKTNVYSSAFFSITGFHGSHVFVGLAMFLCILFPALSGKISVPFVKSASIYWHFVDVVWLFVVSQVYFW